MLKTSNVLVYIVLTDKHQSKSPPQNFHAEISKAIKSALSLKISEESQNALKDSLFHEAQTDGLDLPKTLTWQTSDAVEAEA